METEQMTDKNYLEELYRQTEGNIETQKSMYEVGTTIGLEKDEAGSVAQDLIVEGLAELRTLAGNISITREGLKSLGIASSAPAATGAITTFGKEMIMTESDNDVATGLINEIKTFTASLQVDYSVLEEIVIDIKTIELHMLSPHPKNGVMRELFRSLHSTISSQDENPITERLLVVINS
jgi:hypothetical protein